MSVQALPNTGTLGNDTLDELRTNALMAVDRGEKLPAAITNYIRAIERIYLDAQAASKRDFASESWELRTATPTQETKA